MKVLVCGGRNYKSIKELNDFLNTFHARHQITLLITGAAKGADRLADGWASRQGIARAIFPANWIGEGHSAGFKRNRRMIDITNPDVVIAFSGGPGTANTVEQAKRVKIVTIEVGPLP